MSSASQRKNIDRDSRCGDARSKTDAFVASEGKALQTGVDAMAALEKCAVLSRVGDWADFRDYVVTAAAAIAYSVGVDANDDRLLKRAAEDASGVTGFEAADSAVTVLVRQQSVGADSNTATGHGLTDGPAQNTEGFAHESKHVAAYSSSYGKVATAIARASNARLLVIGSRAPTSPEH